MTFSPDLNTKNTWKYIREYDLGEQNVYKAFDEYAWCI